MTVKRSAAEGPVCFGRMREGMHFPGCGQDVMAEGGLH